MKGRWNIKSVKSAMQNLNGQMSILIGRTKEKDFSGKYVKRAFIKLLRGIEKNIKLKGRMTWLIS